MDNENLESPFDVQHSGDDTFPDEGSSMPDSIMV